MSKKKKFNDYLVHPMENVCNGCPVGMEPAMHFGCLPEYPEVVEMYANGEIWACHNNDSVPCKGALYAIEQEFGEVDFSKPLRKEF
jgi:hypothetical protein